MNKKISLYDIAEMLTEKTGISTTQAERFLQELVALVNEGITKDRRIKIKDIGTFSIVYVKEKESVHVNTGERFVIPAHHKLTFLPEKSLKELINRPFSLFEAIETTDESTTLTDVPVSDEEDEEDEEDEMELEELITPVKEALPAADNKTSPPIEEVRENTEEIRAGVNEKPAEQPAEKKEIRPPVSGSKAKNKLILSVPRWINRPMFPSEKIKSYIQSIQFKNKKMNHSSNHPNNRRANQSPILYLYYTALVVLLCVLGGCIWYLFFHENPIEQFEKQQLAGTFVLPGDTIPKIKPDTVTAETTFSVDSPMPIQAIPEPTPRPPVKPAPAKKATAAKTVKTASSDNRILAKIKLNQGERLTLIAEKYYGNKIFWVYIYLYNITTIGPNPNYIPIGVDLLIPAKEVYGINSGNQAYEKARALQREILAGIQP